MNFSKQLLFFLRLPVALSMLGHGLVRLPKLDAFSAWMSSSMEKSYLPAILITAFGYILPLAELLLGALYLSKWKTRELSYCGLALMAILIFGSTTIENWGAIEAQLLHALNFGLIAVLLDKPSKIVAKRA